MNINWKQKLASRKFWAALIGFAAAIAAAFGIDSITSEQITAIISAVGILVAYIIGESCVDTSRGSAESSDSKLSDSGNGAGDNLEKSE